MTLCTLRAATVLSRDCRADFGRPLRKKVMSHSRDGPGVTAPLRTNIVTLTGVWKTPRSVTPPLKSPRAISGPFVFFRCFFRIFGGQSGVGWGFHFWVFGEKVKPIAFGGL